ncbi:Carboxylesterase protein [Dioscorea alata]|uniref:Carboxylesterase protein n=1 Tax=Dioscorea alata TaxID=55571 RepID=A0ACB7U1F7_DIOAL|nr:Carboxylesterase protein [Dioscorea alata]
MDKKKQHFVMVHGVGHGAWCWFKLQHLLESSGHKVSCLDLAGAGISTKDPNSILSFDDYHQPLYDYMSALPLDEKVVLVHSAGGLNVTKAMNEFSNNISLAIFIAATMLPSGFVSDQDLIAGIPNLSEFGDVYKLEFSLGPENPPTSIGLKKEFQRRILYQMSPKEDSSLASMLLRPWPYAISKARFGGDKEINVKNVRRVYIKTKYDNMVKPEQQEAMIRRWPPNDVMIINTDHSPFFSASHELFNLIIKASSSC